MSLSYIVPKEKVRLWDRFIQEYPTGSNVTVVHDRLLKYYVETDPEKAESFARECLLKEDLPGDRSLKHSAYRALFEVYWKAGEVRKEARLVQELLESGYPNVNAYTHVASHYAKERRVAHTKIEGIRNRERLCFIVCPFSYT